FARHRLAFFVEHFRNVPKRDAELFLESHLAFENRRWAGHARPREHCRINAVTRRVRKRDAFPMRKFSDARLPKRRAIHTGDVNGVSRPLGIELDQLCCGERTRERAVSRMIPSARTNARRVTKPALHLVSDRRDTDRRLAARAAAPS